MESILDTINEPKDLKVVPLKKLPQLAREIREEIVQTISQTGGHLAPSLGTVEITIALHYVLDAPRDTILWDVGHQSYAHKILTGRRKRFSTIRQLGGISGFPNRNESKYDIVTCGHSSTAISVGLGLALARDLKKEKKKVAVVIGDAALAGGMSFEALNHAGQLKKDLMVILNDNEFSISPAVGALSGYLNRIITNPIYNKVRKDVERLLKRIPRFGFKAYRSARKLEEGLKNLLIPGILFEELGFRYFGPIDGHNIPLLVSTLKNLAKLSEPILIHVVTKKGKGYKFAEENPSAFHGTSPFSVETGKKVHADTGGMKTFTAAFGEKIVSLARENSSILGITAAMPEGTGLARFASMFPERFFDAGIAEQHAVGLAGGFALGGFRPVVAIYSTFLQRGYDQIIHDVALQNQPVVFCLDRAGIVGEDGPTHHGLFDIPFLRHVPNLTVMAPKSPEELEAMLEFSLSRAAGPVAIRYPRGTLLYRKAMPVGPIEYGKAEVLREGKDVILFAVGSMVEQALEIQELLLKRRVHATVVNARFIKPLDEELLEQLLGRTKKMVVLEEGCIEGGFGSAILEFLSRENLQGLRVKLIGLPSKFIEHGKREELFLKYNLTPSAVCDVINREVLQR
ncbi:MAG: 1-deoxy-D-xylulose-5-phosphate synthase [Candidatus Omnitrophota bacterium]